MAKMSASRLGSARIAAIAECSRNFFDSLIHFYNNKGIDSVLEIATIPGRPGRLKGHMDEISGRLESEVPRSSAEAAHIIRYISCISFSLTWTREIMHRCGLRRNRSGLLFKQGYYEPVAVEGVEAVKDEVAKQLSVMVVVMAMKFVHSTTQESINWQKYELNTLFCHYFMIC